MDIQSLFNEYNGVTYLSQHFSETEDWCLSNRECSVQEVVYHILPELRLRRIFPAVCFVNTNPLEERVLILLSEKERRGLPDDSPNIFKKLNIDRYLERPSPTFCNGKYSTLVDFCFAWFWKNYTLENITSKTCEYQPDELNYKLIE